MMPWRRTGGWLVLLLTIVAFLGYRYIRFVLSSPASIVLADMPEEEFAQNASLFLQNTGEELTYEISADSAADILGLLREYQSPAYLLWEVHISRFSESSTRTQYGAYLKQGGDYDVEVREGGVLVRSVRSRAGALTVSTGAGSLRASAQPVYRPMPVLGMAEIDSLTGLDPTQVLDARLDTLDSRQVVYVEFTYPDLPVVERYWISLELGLPLRVETRLEDRLIYQAVTDSISATPPQSSVEES